MRIAPFPHRYIVKLEGNRLHSLPREMIHVGAPPQFGGSDLVWSPEELLVGAVLACFKTTFDAFARRDALEIGDWSATATGVLEKTAAGPRFAELDLHVTIAVDPTLEDKARTVAAVAERNCIVSHALRCPVYVTVAVEPLPIALAEAAL